MAAENRTKSNRTNGTPINNASTNTPPRAAPLHARLTTKGRRPVLTIRRTWPSAIGTTSSEPVYFVAVARPALAAAANVRRLRPSPSSRSSHHIDQQAMSVIATSVVPKCESRT